MQLGIHEIWPQGVGYNVNCGYVSEEETITDGDDGIEKIQNLVKSWQFTARNHGFGSEVVSTLSITKPLQIATDALIISYKTSDLPNQEKLVRIQHVQASADVDADPADTCIQLTFKGRNMLTGKNFSLTFSVYRRPKVHDSLSYTEN